MNELTKTNSEIEADYLGAILRSSSNAEIAMPTFDSKVFIETEHRYIAQAFDEIYESGSLPQVALLVGKLRDKKHHGNKTQLDFITREKINKLKFSSEEFPDFEIYRKILLEIYRKRKLTLEIDHIASSIEDYGNTDEALADIEKRISNIALERATDDDTLIEDAYLQAVDNYAILAANRGELIGHSTGFRQLDKITGGLRPGKFAILSARPGMGKTSLALNIASTIAVDNNKPVLFFSLEMGQQELVNRMLSFRCSIPYERIRDVELTETDWQKIGLAYADIKESPLIIHDNPHCSFYDIRAIAFQALREFEEPPVIFIDYLQKLNFGGSRYRGFDNEGEKIGDAAKNMKILSQELETTVFCLSQNNRKSEVRDNKRPVEADLRSSGQIEQDADLIIFIYRDERYYPGCGDQSIAEIIVAKNREGKQGTIKLGFIPQFTRFINLVEPGEIIAGEIF